VPRYHRIVDDLFFLRGMAKGTEGKQTPQVALCISVHPKTKVEGGQRLVWKLCQINLDTEIKKFDSLLISPCLCLASFSSSPM